MPFADVIYANARHRRLSDLTAADVLRVSCVTCFHDGTHSPWHLYLDHPPEMRLDDLMRDIRCPKCRRVGGRDWRIMRAHYAPPARTED